MMYAVKNQLTVICLCLSIFFKVDSVTLDLHNGKRSSRQAYYFDNNCTSFNDPTLCKTAVELSNRFPTLEVSENGCILPPHPVPGKWLLYGKNSSSLSPGMWASVGTALQVQCPKGYKLEGNSLLVCISGNWTSDMGQCLRTCPPRYSTAVTKIICVIDGIEAENCTAPTDGTTAKYECAPFHENLNLQSKPFPVCRYGVWSEPHYECTPICGKKAVSAQMLIVNGTTAKEGAYPWQVALYRGWDNIFACGGSLISLRIILTAAQCITNPNGRKLSKDEFTVAFGKHYSKYDDPRDANSAQFSKLDDMFIPETYHGIAGKFIANIAILVTTKQVATSQRVQPVCVDWGLAYDFSVSSNNVFGYVAGWGYTKETGSLSQELKEVKVPLINSEKCFDNLPEEFAPFFTTDKQCAGYLNQSTSVCLGDNGGGLIVEKNGRYYIIGIVSTGSRGRRGGCNSQSYTLYTNIANYTDSFIQYKMTQQRNSQSQQKVENTTKCTLPQPPNNGKLSVRGSQLSSDSDSTVPSYTTITVACEEFYTLQGPSAIKCNNGQWDSPVGICLAPCPPLMTTRSTKIRCRGVENCINATHGTIATLKCNPFYENLDLNVNPFRTCQNGQWLPKIPRCVPVCGVKPEIGTQQENSYYPWNVAIYKQGESKKLFTCAGTLVNERIILTSAQCISDKDGDKLSPALYKVVVGKSTQNVEGPEDDEVQFSELEEIFVPDEYKGITRKYWADIAVLITKQSFNMTKRVQLLCIDWENKLSNEFEYPKIQGNISAPFESQPSRHFFEIEVPFVDVPQCYKQLSEDSEFDTSYYTFDKLCSGYIHSNKTPCNVNLGSGLVSHNRYDNRYYLTGIASVFPATRAQALVHKQKWILFTQVSKYTSRFILEKNKLYTPLDAPYFQTFCGIKSVQAQTLIIDGNNVTKGDYPWQVAIYEKRNNKNVLTCGGSLINQRIILTAAHCMVNSQGNKKPIEIFTVAVGKYYRSFNHPDDKNAQFSKLIDVFVHNLYQGALQNYVGDIAILITEKSFALSREVKPICVDWENKYESHLLKPNAIGYVSGWGHTKESGSPSEILKDLEVPYIERSQCKKDIPENYDIYLTFDKMCSGYLKKGKNVCGGDSGGGLVFKNGIDGRYYITGIVSLSPQAPTGGCDSQKYALYTRVSQYVKDFIVKKAQLYWR